MGKDVSEMCKRWVTDGNRLVKDGNKCTKILAFSNLAFCNILTHGLYVFYNLYSAFKEIRSTVTYQIWNKTANNILLMRI